MMALAVLRQCTRKNVGGIMSDDLFSFTNCGEPKQVVSEFIDEVVTTMEWVTEEVRESSHAPPGMARKVVESPLKREIDKELRTKTEECQTLL